MLSSWRWRLLIFVILLVAAGNIFYLYYHHSTQAIKIPNKASKARQLSASTAPGRDPNHILVKYAKNTPHSLIAGAQKIKSYDNFPDIDLVNKPADKSLDDSIAEFKQNKNVVYAEPDYIYQTQAIPNDPMYTQQWDMAKISAPAAWDTQTDASDVIVAVVDTGIDYTHPDLQNNLWTNPADGAHGYNCDTGAIGGEDTFGHGTHVAGTIGAVANNNVGIAGENWKVKLASFRGLPGGNGYSSVIAECFDMIATLKSQGVNIRVTNDSWGGFGHSQVIEDAMRAVAQLGVSHVVAAGNSQVDIDIFNEYPASLDIPGLISVAATDYSDNLAYFSDYGTKNVDIAAPGTDILSTLSTNCTANSICSSSGYGLLSGTSMATPHVAGAMAMLYHLNENLTPDQARNVLLDKSNTDPLSGRASETSSGGRLDIAKLVSSPLVANPPANHAPVLSAESYYQNVTPGSTITLPTATDPDGDTVKVINYREDSRYPDLFTNYTNSFATTALDPLYYRALDQIFPGELDGQAATFTAPTSLSHAVSVDYLSKASDLRGGADMRQTIISVPASSNPGKPPTGNLTASATSITNGQSVTFSWPLVDPEGKPVVWGLDNLNLSDVNGKSPCCYFGNQSVTVTISNYAPGTYTFSAHAMDADLNLVSSSVKITIGGSTTSGDSTAKPTVDKTIGIIPLTVNYNVGQSVNRYSENPEVFCMIGSGGQGVFDTPTSKGMCGFNTVGPQMINNNGTWFYIMALANSTPDTTPPTVNITSPANGSTVSNMGTNGSFTVSAAASDNVGIGSRVVTIDNEDVERDIFATPPYPDITLSDASYSNGPHTLRVTVTDYQGNTTTATSVFTVDNDFIPPTITSMSPANNTAIPTKSTVTLSGSASDNRGLQSITITYPVQSGNKNIMSSYISHYTCALNGQKTGSCSVAVSMSNMSPGQTSTYFSVSAVDMAGNQVAQSNTLIKQ